jgi:glycosyltransferase involved in cell wall biosynthesis
MQKAFLGKCHAAMNRRYLLFLGRIDEKKGVDLLVEAYEKIVADHTGEPDELPMLVIAGPGLDTPYGEKIKQLVEASSHLPSYVAFTGMLEGEAKWGAFYCADAFILPSHQENFGIALVEAMACSKPVLISNKVNIWQEVIKAHGGLAADDTAEGILLLLTRWITLHPEQQKLMAVRARQCYEKQFSVEMAARQMLQALGIDHKPASVKKYVAG